MKPPRTRPTIPTPELRHGDQMSQAEFHRCYEAYPEDVKFELIGGIVYMGSPLHRPHGTATHRLAGVLFHYEAATPGVEGGDNMTAVLGEKSEPQPDLMLRLLTECDGQSRYEKNLLIGAPELVVEVSDTTHAFDLGAKKDDYLAAGVQEYLVVDLDDQEIHWFYFPSKRKLKADRDGVWKSRGFPGLWFDGPALLTGDLPKLLATVQKGIDSPAHADFVRLLQERRESHHPE